jgi:uncharacterized protein (DUF3084 family)
MREIITGAAAVFLGCVAVYEIRGFFRQQFSFIHKNQLKIMATQAELAAQLNTVATQVGKIGQESTKTLEKVQELEEALANQDNVSPELQTAFDNLKSQVQTVDDLVVDTTIPPTEEPEEPQV